MGFLLVVAAVFGVCPWVGCGSGGGKAGDVLGHFGETGLGEGEFSYPRAIAINPEGLVYVVDKSGRIQRFAPDGTWQLQWSMPEFRNGKPTGLTVDTKGRVFVADTHYYRVMVFDRDGKKLGDFGSQGRGDGQFELPTDVAIDREGFVYVSEYGGNDRISKYTPDWKFVASFGGPDSGPAALSRPSGLLFDENDDLWVADACNHRICRFDRSGKLLSTFGSLGDKAGQLSYPYDIDLLSDGTLLVCEYGNNRLQRFDRSGRSLGTWGTAGRKLGQLAYPWGVAVGQDRKVYVVDSGNSRIQIVAM
ncbi:MAG: hypothetical protein JXQ73_21520 [Phycisphaerae bacterium]|nr:hypothetical protein [Phycisphaerae bacterium]